MNFANNLALSNRTAAATNSLLTLINTNAENILLVSNRLTSVSNSLVTVDQSNALNILITSNHLGTLSNNFVDATNDLALAGAHLLTVSNNVNSLSNALGTAAFVDITQFQATNAFLTQWAKHQTNDYASTNYAAAQTKSNVIAGAFITIVTNGNALTISSSGGGSGGGISSLNGLTNGSQNFATGTNGAAFAIVSSGSTHTFNLPLATATNRGQLDTNDFQNFTNKITPAQLTTATNSNFNSVTNAAKTYADAAIATATNSTYAAATNAARIFTTNTVTTATNAIFISGTNAAKTYADAAIATATNSTYAAATNAARTFTTNTVTTATNAIFMSGTNAAKTYADAQLLTRVRTNETRPVTFGDTVLVSNTITAFGLTLTNLAGVALFNADGDPFLSVDGNGRTLIKTAPASGLVGLSVFGDSDVTADIQDWRTSGGTVLAAISKEGRMSGAEPSATNDFTTKSFTQNAYIPKSIGGNPGDIAVRNASGWTVKAVGPDNSVLTADSSQATRFSYKFLTAVATNAVGNYNGHGTNVSIHGNSFLFSPLRIYSSTGSLANIDIIDTNNFGSAISFKSSTNYDGGTIWYMASDGATNGNFMINTAEGITGSDVLTFNRGTHLAAFSSDVVAGGSVTANAGFIAEKTLQLVDSGFGGDSVLLSYSGDSGLLSLDRGIAGTSAEFSGSVATPSITLNGDTRTSWPGGGGSQTPITQTVDYDGFSATNLASLQIGNTNSFGTLFSKYSNAGFKFQSYDDTGASVGSFSYDFSGADNFIFSRSILVTGAIECTGKLTATGGIDPPYVLYDAHSRAETKTRVLAEVPLAKQTGAALFWNPSTHRLETYIASEDKFYDLSGNELNQ